MCLIFVISACWYGSVSQKDRSNWGQTLVGTIVSTIILLTALIMRVVQRIRKRRAGFQLLHGQNTFGGPINRSQNAYTSNDYEGGGYEPISLGEGDDSDDNIPLDHDVDEWNHVGKVICVDVVSQSNHKSIIST